MLSHIISSLESPWTIMNKTKLTLLNKHISSSNDGVILISMSIGIFLIISIFTFFLMKLVVKEHNMSMLHTLDVKTRNLSHSALEKGIFQFSDYRNITTQNGELNNGEYNISYDGIKNENDEPLIIKNWPKPSKIDNLLISYIRVNFIFIIYTIKRYSIFTIVQFTSLRGYISKITKLRYSSAKSRVGEVASFYIKSV